MAKAACRRKGLRALGGHPGIRHPAQSKELSCANAPGVFLLPGFVACGRSALLRSSRGKQGEEEEQCHGPFSSANPHTVLRYIAPRPATSPTGLSVKIFNKPAGRRGFRVLQSLGIHDRQFVCERSRRRTQERLSGIGPGKVHRHQEWPCLPDPSADRAPLWLHCA